MMWTNNISNLTSCLNSLSAQDDSGCAIDTDLAFSKWTNETIKVRKKRNTVYLIGNGASASMSSHTAADLAKNGKVRTEVFTDLSLITAIANDYGYEDVFAEPLRQRMCAGDILVAISSSGESSNILSAVQTATALGGFVVTLSAMRQNNILRESGGLNFYVPARTYGIAETCHAAILHCWIDNIANSTE